MLQRLKTVLLTDSFVRGLPTSPAGQYVVRDTLPGFYVVVGKRAKTFTVQHDVYELGRRKTIKRSIGRFGELSCRNARAEAKRVLGNIATRRAGPNDPGPSLQEAWIAYEKRLRKKNRSERTIDAYRDSIERVLADWQKTPLTELAKNPLAVSKRHDEITTKHGPVCANHAVQAIRAIYNHARKAYTMLPADNPARAVEFNPVERRDSGMALEDLPDWFRQLDALPNLVRREFHLFLLLSGSRPTVIIRAEWRHLDVARRALRIPKPKGGAKRTFNIPLSRQMLACLARARRAARVLHAESADHYIFPADTPTGYIAEWKERRTVLSRWGVDLRHSYAAIAKQLEVEAFFLKLLMNHKVADVTDGYAANTSLFRHLVRVQDGISRAIAGERVND